MKLACRLLLPVVVFCASLLRVSEADACSCMRSPSAKVAMAGADQVAVARVVEITAGSDAEHGPAIPQVRVKLEIERSYKGATAGSFEVSTATTGAACGFPFEKVSATSCTPTPLTTEG